MPRAIFTRKKATEVSLAEQQKIEPHIKELEENIGRLSPQEEHELDRLTNESGRMRDMYLIATKPTLLDKIKKFLGR